mmetsp:Transcript_4366/g.13093  ORF Transcript_4366/g.13093 Transcript_4366/m.13093 type:complete len:281 (-) Transcript_4366:2347-3189(-)
MDVRFGLRFFTLASRVSIRASISARSTCSTSSAGRSLAMALRASSEYLSANWSPACEDRRSFRMSRGSWAYSLRASSSLAPHEAIRLYISWSTRRFSSISLTRSTSLFFKPFACSMTSSRFSLSARSTWSFSARASRSWLWEFRTTSALSSSFRCSSLSTTSVFSALSLSCSDVTARSSDFLAFFSMASASSRAFLVHLRCSSHLLVASSRSALPFFSSSPPMFMIWLWRSRTSSSTAWCWAWIWFSSPSLDAMSFSSSFSLFFSPLSSVGTFSVLRRWS